MEAQVRLVVADDNARMLQRLVSLLEVEFQVVATAADGNSALDLVHHWKPDVVILDLNMPMLNGIEVTRKLANDPQSPPVVICSAEASPKIVEAALGAGVKAYVFKARIEEDLVLAVQSARQGRTFVSTKSKSSGRVSQVKFFKGLGHRIRELRQKAGYTQTDMIYFGFSIRHWHQIEAGRPITIPTLLRICRVFNMNLEDLLHGLALDIHHD